MTEQLVDSLGLGGFFVASLLAATVLPLAIEAIVPVMVSRGFSTAGLVISGTLGGWVGSLINYRIGAAGGDRLERTRPDRFRRARDWIDRNFRGFGQLMLLFSWLPFLGEVITLAAGVAKVNLLLFSALTIIGRALRILGLIHLTNWIF